MEEDINEPELILMAEPLSPMLAMAREAHMLLSAYQRVGFTRAEAFDIVLNQLPEWNFPSPFVVEREDELEDDDDDLWEDIPDEMTEDDD
jgi:hypothetical protein